MTHVLESAEQIAFMLRDRAATVARIHDGTDLPATIRRSLAWSVASAACFGVALGAHAGTKEQMLASAIKVPLLLLGTALVCFPTFHVLQVLRSPAPLTLAQSLALQCSSLLAVALLWASFAPPLLFLITTGDDYRLAQILAILIGAFGGLVGMVRLVRGFRELCQPDGTLRGSEVVLVHLLAFSMVGAQMSWMLRPIIGSPNMPFQIFRQLQGSFFSHLLELLGL